MSLTLVDLIVRAECTYHTHYSNIITAGLNASHRHKAFRLILRHTRFKQNGVSPELSVSERQVTVDSYEEVYTVVSLLQV